MVCRISSPSGPRPPVVGVVHVEILDRRGRSDRNRRLTPARRSTPTPTGTATTSAATTARSDVPQARARSFRAWCSRAPGVMTGSGPSALYVAWSSCRMSSSSIYSIASGLTHQLSKPDSRAGCSRLHRRHRYPQDAAVSSTLMSMRKRSESTTRSSRFNRRIADRTSSRWSIACGQVIASSVRLGLGRLRLPLAPRAPALVDDDREEPGSGAAVVAKLAHPPPRLERRALHRVLSRASVRREGLSQRKRVAEVWFDEKLELTFVI